VFGHEEPPEHGQVEALQRQREAGLPDGDAAAGAGGSGGAAQRGWEHPLVDARRETGRLVQRQQERAGMLPHPLFAGLPAGEEVHKVAEALHDPGVEWALGQQERHDRPGVRRPGDPVRPDRELDQVAGDWAGGGHVPVLPEPGGQEERVPGAPRIQDPPAGLEPVRR
jgi:hypothetical protein